MKVTRNITVLVDGAEFIFKKPSAKTILGLRETPTNSLGAVFEGLVQVKGIVDETGAEISTEDVRTLELPMDTIIKIVEGYNQALAGLLPGASESPEKKL